MIRAACALGVLGLFVAMANRDARADDAPACNAWDVEYATNATMRITDTMMGGGDGTWPIGPGRVVVRFDNADGSLAPGGSARLLDYKLHEAFTVKANILVSSAVVTADTTSVTTPDACGFSAQGTLTDHTLKWSGPWQGMRSDGTLTCAGGLCGKFGAPPPGQSPIHVPPHTAAFKSFVYAADYKTFTMEDSVAGHQDSPSSTSHIALAGREMKRTCVVAKACP